MHFQDFLICTPTFSFCPQYRAFATFFKPTDDCQLSTSSASSSSSLTIWSLTNSRIRRLPVRQFSNARIIVETNHQSPSIQNNGRSDSPRRSSSDGRHWCSGGRSISWNPWKPKNSSRYLQCRFEFLLFLTPILTTIHRLSPFPFRSLHPFRFPFFHHSNSTRRRTRRRYVWNYDLPICIRLSFP